MFTLSIKWEALPFRFNVLKNRIWRKADREMGIEVSQKYGIPATCRKKYVKPPLTFAQEFKTMRKFVHFFKARFSIAFHYQSVAYFLLNHKTSVTST